MKIEIDIDEYFTPEMIKEIAEDELVITFAYGTLILMETKDE